MALSLYNRAHLRKRTGQLPVNSQFFAVAHAASPAGAQAK